MQPQEMTEEQKAKQTEKMIELEEKKTSASDLDAYALRLEQQRLAAMDEASRQMKALGISRMGQDELAIEQLTMESDLPEMSLDLSRKEAAKKKGKKKQAKQRMQEQSRKFDRQRMRQLLADRAAFAEEVEQNPLPEDYTKVELGRMSDLFRVDPQTKRIDGKAMLETRRRLAFIVQRLREKKEAGGVLTLQETAQSESYAALLTLLQDAIQAFYARNNVDVRYGEILKREDSVRAKKRLDLAVERFELLARALKLDMGQRVVEQLTDSPLYRVGYEQDVANRLREDREATERDLHAEISLSIEQRMAVTRTRDLITGNAANYATNKTLVDRIYSEYITTQKVLRQKEVPLQMQLRVLREAYPNGGEGFTLGEAYLQKQQADLGLYRESLRHQSAALQFLLQGSEPTDALTAAYLKQSWGIETKLYEKLDDMVTALDRADRKVKPSERGALDLILQREFRAEAKELRELFTQLHKDIAEKSKLDPKNLQFQQDLETLKHAEKVGSLRAMREAWSRIGTEAWNAQKLTEACCKVGEHSYPNTALYRDGYHIISPLEGESAVDEKALSAYYQNTYILQNGTRLDGTEATEAQQKQAYKTTLALYLQNAVEVKAYTKNIGTFFHLPSHSGNEEVLKAKREEGGILVPERFFLQPKQVLQASEFADLLLKKTTALSGGCRMLSRHPEFGTLTEKQKSELYAAEAAFLAVTQFCRTILDMTNVMERSGAIRSEEMLTEAFPLPLDLLIREHEIRLKKERERF